MTKTMTTKLFGVFAVTALVALSSTQAHAGGGSNFSEIAGNIVESIAQLPSLLSAVSYMFGILLGVLGVLKIKDHVENPGNTPLKDGAIRLAAGGGLLALPIIYSAMQNTIGQGESAEQAILTDLSFGG